MYYKLANFGKSLFANSSNLYKKSPFGKSSILYKKFIFGKSCILYQKPLFTKVFISYLTFDFTRQYSHHQFLNRKCIAINNENLKDSNESEPKPISDIIKGFIDLCLIKLPPGTLNCCIFSLCIRNVLWKQLSHGKRRKIMNKIRSNKGKFIGNYLIFRIIYFQLKRFSLIRFC